MTYPWAAGEVLLAADLNSALAAKTDLAMVQNAQTGTSYSMALADASKLLTMSNAASNTILVTKQATVTWVTGTQLRVMNLGAGVTTLVADTGVTINGNVALKQYQGGTLIRTASDVWLFVPTASKGTILQVVSTTKTDTFSTSSTSFVDITGFSATITPTSATSKVLVLVNSNYSTDGTMGVFRLMRDATAIAIGDAASNRSRAFASTRIGDGPAQSAITANFLDSPSAVAATVYKIQMLVQSGTNFVNRSFTDTDAVYIGRTVSSITLMEVSA